MACAGSALTCSKLWSGATAFCLESNQKSTNILVVKGTMHTGMKDVHTKAIVIILASFGIGRLKNLLKKDEQFDS